MYSLESFVIVVNRAIDRVNEAKNNANSTKELKSPLKKPTEAEVDAEKEEGDKQETENKDNVEGEGKTTNN